MRLFGLIMALFCVNAWAGHVNVNAKTAGGGIYRVNAHTYMNAYGRREVRLESNIVGAVQGFGRDLDDDGKIETWFMLSQDRAFDVHILATNHPWGLDAVEHQLFKRFKSSRMASVSSAFGSVMSAVLVSAASAYGSQEQLYRELLDLEEFRIRLERAQARGQIDREQWRESADIMMRGFAETIARFERAMGGQYWTLVGVDAGLWVTGGYLIGGFAKAVGIVARPLATAPGVAQAREAFGTISNAFVKRYRRELARIRVLRGGAANLVATSVFRQSFPTAMRSLMGKNVILRKTLPAIARVGRGFSRATLGWKYIAFMAGLQLTTESFAHYDEVKSADPTEFAKNVMTNPAIIQNVSYMTSNAYLMTAASHSVRRPKMKFAIGGFIALSNSGVNNLVIRGSDDYRRIALDTSWEAIIGNAQIQLDLKALQHFERVAARNNNPRLKLVGWAVVFVDQVAGFAGYSAATRMIDNEPKEVHIVPVHVLR